MDVAIIGAGIAGLACAGTLRDAGYRPTLFEKAGSAGGRMATQIVETELGEIAFDYGATHFTARSRTFRALVDRWQRNGLAERWPAAGLDAWVGTPTIGAPLEALAADHDVHWRTPISALIRSGQHWWLLSDGERYGPFDAVVVALPAEQAAPLLSVHVFDMARAAMAVRYHPMWSAIYVFPDRLEGVADFLRAGDPIVHAVRETAKPGRPPIEAWVVQANWGWSERHLTLDAGQASGRLLRAFDLLVDCTLPEPIHAGACRWQFAQPSGTELGFLWDENARIGACGDWLTHGFVELVWQSGHALGSRIAT